MQITSAVFVKGATNQQGYPNLGVPEFAFYGKSNTGKSSIINMICGRNGLVKTSNRPGMTKEINFFLVNETMALVDLPGIGYSKLPGTIRKDLEPMIDEYCHHRKDLLGIFYLMDLRRDFGSTELSILSHLRGSGRTVQILGTKADKLTRHEVNQKIFSWARVIGCEPDSIVVTSSVTREGQVQVRKIIESQLQNKVTQK